MLGILVASLVSLAQGDGAASAARITVGLPAAQAAVPSETASQEAAGPSVGGTEAHLINAALPISDEPLQLARAFVLKGSSTDERLALTCLSQAVYYEAGSEPLTGQRAVAQVVLNRLRHPSFPKSVCGVVYQGAGSGACQFTFVCDGSLDRSPSRDGWRDAEAVARAALSGYVEPSVGEATNYHADYVAPGWAPLLAKIGAIGQHIFYRFPGAAGQAAVFNGRYAGEPRDPLTIKLAQSTYKLMNGGAPGAGLIAPPNLPYSVKKLIGASLASGDDGSSSASAAAPPSATVTPSSIALR